MPKTPTPTSKTPSKGTSRTTKRTSASTLLSDRALTAPSPSRQMFVNFCPPSSSADDSRNQFTVVVEVTVGPDQELFRIHKYLLVQDSAFFAAALGGDWTEARTGVVRLSEEQPKIFKLYAVWLYSQDFAKALDILIEQSLDLKALTTFETTVAEASMVEALVNHPGFLSGSDTEWTLTEKRQTALGHLRMSTVFDTAITELLNVYVLGEHLQSEGLRNEAIDLLVDVNVHHRECFPMLPVKCSWLAFDNTPKNSALRRLVVHWIACWSDDEQAHWPHEDFRKWDQQPPEFLASMVEFLYDVKIGRIDGKNIIAYNQSVCKDYHYHKNGTTCAPRNGLNESTRLPNLHRLIDSFWR